MIHIVFVPGMFGSTIEFIIQNFSKEYESINADVLQDGSMHSFKKKNHWYDLAQMQLFYQSGPINPTTITSITYPHTNHHLPEIVQSLYSFSGLTDKKLLVYANSFDAAEINLLFQYYKISIGLPKLGIDIFFKGVNGYTRWNPTYTSWQDMKPWELREWFSIFYPDSLQEWIISKDQVDDTFLKISTQEILSNTKESFERIIEHCELTLDSNGLAEFAVKWRDAQQYIINEYNLLMQIVDDTMLNRKLTWRPLNLIAEVIIQRHLRVKGYEIRCDGLNTFPTDSKTLYNLLEKI